MITHEIKHPTKEAVTLFKQAKESVLKLIGHQQQSVGVGANEFMGKQVFAGYIEEIKKEWPKGSFCTLSALAYIPDKDADPLFRVVDHQEIHWNAPLDNVHKQPRCIYVQNVRYENTVVPYPPKALRKLTEEELNFVDIRNKTRPLVLPASDETLDWEGGKWLLRDKLTRKLIKEYPGTESTDTSSTLPEILG